MYWYSPPLLLNMVPNSQNVRAPHMDNVPERVFFVKLVTNHGLGAQMVLSISSDLKITKK